MHVHEVVLLHGLFIVWELFHGQSESWLHLPSWMPCRSSIATDTMEWVENMAQYDVEKEKRILVRTGNQK